MAVAEILGREAEVNAVGRFVDGPAPAALVLEGPAGVGKTTVWRAGVQHAAGLGHRVLMTRPSEAETAPAMAGLMDLLGDVYEEYGAALPAPQRSALAVALLREDGDHAEVAPGTLSAAALGLVRRAAEEAPVLLAVDDLQWLDAATASTLAFVLRRLAPAPVLLLATARSENGDATLVDGGRMVIPPLDVESLSRLIARELGHRVARPVVRRIATIASGNAFLAVELARLAVASGGDPDELSPAVLARSSEVRRVAEARVRVLPDDTRTALAIVAALGEPRLAVLSRALEDEAALDVAFDARVIEEQGARVRFTHPLLAAGALAAVSPRRRRSVHRRLAELASTAEERATHLAAATTEPSAELAAAVEAGAGEALSRGAPAAAARLYEEASRLEPADAAARTERLLRAGTCRETAGDTARALELFRRALAESQPGPQRARARAWVATHEHVALDESDRQLRLAISECADDGDARVECLVSLGMSVALAGDLTAALSHYEQAQRLSERVEDVDLRIWALSQAGFARALSAPGQGRPELLTAARLADGRLVPSAGAAPQVLLALASSWADEIEPSRTLLLGVLERAVAAGDEQGIGDLSKWLTELEVRAGNLGRARAYADDAVAITDVGHEDLNLGAMLYARALVAAHEGDDELTRRLLARAVAMNERLGELIFVTQARSVLGFLELSMDRPAQAVEHLARVDAALRAIGVGERGAFPHCNDLPEALIGAGRIDEARHRLAEMRTLGGDIPRPRLLCAALRGEAMIAALGGDQATASRLLEQALDVHDELPVPLERGRSLLVAGMAHRRSKHRRAARDRLTEAEALFDGMGARVWRDRARRELGRISGRTPGDRDALTATERQVAELVAAGRTNRDVAAELFITVRTVEANLTRVYAKLGVRSRAELAARRDRL
jgi:DNA-binding CsgD family transcriptional regulator/tetratricopeptide (TPR) repeat protein